MIWNIGLPNNKTRVFLLTVVLLAAMILPAVSLHPSLPSLRLEEGVLFGGLAYCLLKTALYFMKRASVKPWSQDEDRIFNRRRSMERLINIIFIFLITSYIISNIFGVLVKNGSFTMRDVMELVTYLKYYLVLTLALSVRMGEEEWTFLRRSALAGVVFLILFGWLQHLNPLDINHWLTPYFNQNHWEHLILSRPARILGAFDNPNVFGMLTVLILAALTARYFWDEQSMSKGRIPWGLLVLLALVIKLEYLTISRTALLGIALLFSLCCIWAFRRYKRSRAVLIRIAALFLITVILFITAPADFLNRVGEGLDFTSSTSGIGHLERWEMASGSIRESPILGWGTQKTTMTTLVDNEYMLYTRRYGFVGLAAYLSFFLVPWVLAFKALLFVIKKLSYRRFRLHRQRAPSHFSPFRPTNLSGRF